MKRQLILFKKPLILLSIILVLSLVVGYVMVTTASQKNENTNQTTPATEELTGWIIDRDCLGKNVPTAHGKMCNLMGAADTPIKSCYASGLGIDTNISAPTVKTDLANYLVFDEESRTLTQTFLQNLPSTWVDNITVKVIGYKVDNIPANLNETNVPEMDSTKVDHYLSGFHVTSIEAAFIDGISTNPLPSPNLVLPGSAVKSSIAITKPAAKLTYTVGEALDITGLEVTGTYSDKSTKIQTIMPANIMGFDSAAPVSGQVLTITIGGVKTTYTINVVAAAQGVSDPAVAASVPSGSVSPGVSASSDTTPDISPQNVAAPVESEPVTNDQTVTLTGYIQDQDCFISYAPNWGADTKMCLLMHSCAASGYGITALQSDGTYKFYYFDGDFATYEPWSVGTGSQSTAWNFANATTKSNNITGTVTGTLSGGTKVSPYDGLSYPVINVSSLTEN
ncbi:MAG: bacterial Ig-like domain-containing protein [Acetobacterium sp.]